MVKILEGRRPGLQKIYDELAAKHPTWRHDKLVAAAKVEWTSKYVVQGDKIIPNPDVRQ